MNLIFGALMMPGYSGWRPYVEFRKTQLITGADYSVDYSIVRYSLCLPVGEPVL